ncbi:hypothetical protein [Ruminococcus albus]|uniref:Conserved domain protein n=1 Tax=Ruminococcus albus 8 TaxID=246199 RepID=E9S8X3_RUMAL|nr:hypothetical protein [Ruminococcus albus]EGC04256.1 conserved domain protein [Ruminococcus albus 8]MCC3349694.1 hypothetical protein [Ruminococcus albus 8]
MDENIIMAFSRPRVIKPIYNQKLNTSNIMKITSPTEESVKKYVEKYHIKGFDMNSATYGYDSNVMITINTETDECKLQVFDCATGKMIASYTGSNKSDVF